MYKKTWLVAMMLILSMVGQKAWANYILISMDKAQKNHLKAYGIAYWVLSKIGQEVDWLLNYKGGSFGTKYVQKIENELVVRGISYTVISDAQYNQVLAEIGSPSANMDIVKLEKAPKVAVYSPKTKQPWDDAVTLVLTYAEIPYDLIYDDEIMQNKLIEYDWLHLHHEDFTGQQGKFYAQARNQAWYIQERKELENMAKKWGFSKVSQLKLNIVKKIRDFCFGGGFMFAMCSATDTFDIAMAAEGVDICESMYDGDGADPQAQQKLNFKNTLAFKDFHLERNPYVYEYSDVDNQQHERGVNEKTDFFQLFTFSAKWDPIPTMLTQNHENLVKGFMGQTTAFKKRTIKSEVLVLAETKQCNEARYMHGTYGNGTWTFYGGHDPEDYQHFVGEEPTDLNLHPNSPGYRLILNNVLFPAAKKKKQKT